MNTGEHILIVEDDESILAGLALNLEMEGYRVSTAMDGEAGIARFAEAAPDMVILDIMLPRINGYEVLATIRKRNPDVPVLVLTAREHPNDKVLGLGLGADDYLTKPFSLAELLARINAALRRKRLADRSRIEFADVVIETGARRVLRAGQPVDMTTREYELLMYLVRSPDRVFTRAQILDAVWGQDYEGTDRTVDNFIARLRTKIELDPENPAHLQTVRGVGYRFVP